MQRAGFSVTVLTRRPARARRRVIGDVRLIASLAELRDGEHIETVINLAGESLNSGRWSERHKQRLLDSRIGMTQALHGMVSRLTRRPTLLLNGSGVGYYGPQGARAIDERAPGVESFAHRLCAQWEDEARRFESLGLRVCMLRFGAVLGCHGGALRELLKSFALGAAVRLGSGRQWMSWVHLDDVIASIGALIANESIEGPVNVTAPEPVTQERFMEALRERLWAPVRIRVPDALLRLLKGQMADELLLNGQRSVPAKLTQAGYAFRFPRLEPALADLLSQDAQAGHTAPHR